MSRGQTNPAGLQERQDEVTAGEHTPLVVSSLLLARRYRSTRKCVSSKAALLILVWSFVVGLLGGMMLNPEIITTTLFSPFMQLSMYGGTALVTCFFPLAGILADIRFGRYKTIITSIYLVLLSLLLLILSNIFWVLLVSDKLIIEATCLFSVCAGISVVMLYTGLIGFTANVVQFGMDQLHDSPGEERTLFIHWYVWTYYGSILVGQLGVFLIDYNGLESSIFGISLLALILFTLLTVLPITLCLVRRRRRWFLIEPGQYNPYKLVYRVTKFARQHKTPVNRSAFTYCEDEVPMGLDLGKEKYGGPFTTEQVEDVKAFYGILKVLFSFGVVFFLGFAADSTMHYFFITSISYNSSPVLRILINTGLLSPLLITICIPLYLCLLRPFISRYVPGMLKRMGLGMILALLSLLATISMDLVEQLGYPSADSNSTVTTISMGTVGTDYNSTEDDHICMFNKNVDRFYPSHPSYHQNFNLFTIQLTLSALSRMLIYTGVFEFICSQSPHSMKGLIIGVFYAIRALYQVFSALLVLPYSYWGTFKPLMLSCEFYFYLMNTVIGLVAVLVYVWVAKRYRYRVRDELCNVRQYAEEYYSNPNQERFYDYD